MIDYRRTNVAIEAFYLLVPLFISMIVMILMACHYGIGAGYWPTGFIATMVKKEIPVHLWSWIFLFCNMTSHLHCVSFC